MSGARPRSRLGDTEFEEGFASWQEARAASSGYDAPAILEKARAALLKVKRGEAAFERDTVVFERVAYAHPVIAGLLLAAVLNGNRLTVLDFGGSLGSSYYQARAYLDRLEALAWCVVEQPHVVAAGRRDFEDDKLKFYASIDDCVARHAPDVLLLSGVLEYLPEPLAFLREAAARKFPRLLIDRTPLLEEGASRITVQHVPPAIYSASYPCWILRKDEVLAALRDYEVFDAFNSTVEGELVLTDATARFSGFHLRLARA